MALNAVPISKSDSSIKLLTHMKVSALSLLVFASLESASVMVQVSINVFGGEQAVLFVRCSLTYAPRCR